MRHSRRPAARFALLLLGLLLAAPLPAAAQPGGAPSCPLASPTMKARLDAKAYTGRVGVTSHIRVRLTPHKPPEGYFVSAIIDVVSGPEGTGPNILSGVPVSDVTPRAPGRYRLRILVNLIAKSSCGGVKSATLLDRVVDFTVAP